MLRHKGGTTRGCVNREFPIIYQILEALTIKFCGHLSFCQIQNKAFSPFRSCPDIDTEHQTHSSSTLPAENPSGCGELGTSVCTKMEVYVVTFQNFSSYIEQWQQIQLESIHKCTKGCKHPYLSFHSFSTDVLVRKKRLCAIRRDGGEHFKRQHSSVLGISKNMTTLQQCTVNTSTWGCTFSI